MSAQPQENRPLRAILLGYGQRPDILAEAERQRASLVEPLVEVISVDFTGTVDMSDVDADVAIVFGGDGSILRAAHQMGHGQLPIVAVNLGKLGFLADLDPDELVPVLREFQAGRLPCVEHLMFDCRVIRDGEVRHEQLGLNEVAVQTGPPFRIMGIDLYVDSELVTTYSCDG